MKSTLIFATLAFATALWLAFSGSPRRSPVATDVQDTNRPSASDASLPDRRPLFSKSGTAASHPQRKPSANPGPDGRISQLSRGTSRPYASRTQSRPPSGSLAADGVNPLAGLSAKHSTSQASPHYLPEDPYQTPQPAAWVDMGDLVPPDSARDAALQSEAERLLPLLHPAPSDSSLRPDPAALVEMEDSMPPDSQIETASSLPVPPAETAGGSLQPDPPIRQEVVAASDHWFRQRYGSWLWMQHHIQAHHLAASAQAAGN